jgi:hypothetical protein
MDKRSWSMSTCVRGPNSNPLTLPVVNDLVDLKNTCVEIEDHQPVKDIFPLLRTALGAGLSRGELGVTYIKKEELDRIPWEKLVNAAVFVLPRSNMDQHTHYDLRADPNELAVHIYPLPILAAAARLLIQPGGYNQSDFRAYYVYGRRISSAHWWRRAVRTARAHEAKAVDVIYPRRTIVAHQSRILTYRDVCMQSCPRRINWSIGECQFMTYNCIAGTDLFPKMLTCAEPLLEALLPSQTYGEPRTAILRMHFEPYLANNLSNDVENNESLREARSLSAQQGGRLRRLRRLLCPSCFLYSNNRDPLHYGRYDCGTRPDRCRGPALANEVQCAIDKRRTGIEPWQYQVLREVGSSRGSIDVEQLIPLFPWMKNLRAPWRTCRPLDTKTVDTSEARMTNVEFSDAAKSARQCVVLQKDTQKISSDFVVVSYRQWTQLVSLPVVRDWDDLTWTAFVSPQVHLAIANLLHDSYPMLLLFDRTFSMSYDSIGYAESCGGCYPRNKRIELSGSSHIRSQVMSLVIEFDRHAENNELRLVAGDRAEYSRFYSVASYLHALRTLGVLAARETVRRRPRPERSRPEQLELLFGKSG